MLHVCRLLSPIRLFPFHILITQANESHRARLTCLRIILFDFFFAYSNNNFLFFFFLVPSSTTVRPSFNFGVMFAEFLLPTLPCTYYSWHIWLQALAPSDILSGTACQRSRNHFSSMRAITFTARRLFVTIA